MAAAHVFYAVGEEKNTFIYLLNFVKTITNHNRWPIKISLYTSAPLKFQNKITDPYIHWIELLGKFLKPKICPILWPLVRFCWEHRYWKKITSFCLRVFHREFSNKWSQHGAYFRLQNVATESAEMLYPVYIEISEQDWLWSSWNSAVISAKPVLKIQKFWKFSRPWARSWISFEWEIFQRWFMHHFIPWWFKIHDQKKFFPVNSSFVEMKAERWPILT